MDVVSGSLQTQTNVAELVTVGPCLQGWFLSFLLFLFFPLELEQLYFK